MKTIRVHLRPVISRIHLPTVIKTAILPGDSTESIFIATQVGEIYAIINNKAETFLNIRPQVLKLGISNGGYDERGLLGCAFHPNFTENGLFYLHYSKANSQGSGALPSPSGRQGGLPEFFNPDPCNPDTLNLKWENREANFDHIDAVEEWQVQSNRQPQKKRTLLLLRRPFFNHNGVNSLNFSPETKNLVLTTGDGGSGYDPFNLSQDNKEICGKIIEIDINKNPMTDPPVVSRFSELPLSIQDMMWVVAKGVRNIPGISFRKTDNRYIKYVGNVGQDLVETIFTFDEYPSIPVTQLTNSNPLVNFGWRGWEGAFPTAVIRNCQENPALNQKIIAYYDEAITVSDKRLLPLVSYFHYDPRPDKFSGTALTGVTPYLGSIPELSGSIIFCDYARKGKSMPVRGVLGYTKPRTECKLNDFGIIEADYDFGQSAAYYVSLGTNSDQSRLFLGVYGSVNVVEPRLGTVFEIVP